MAWSRIQRKRLCPGDQSRLLEVLLIGEGRRQAVVDIRFQTSSRSGRGPVLGLGLRRPILCWLAVGSLLGLPALASDPQRRAADQPLVPEKVRFEHLTNRDGLSQMAVFAILQDQLGFLWFGTEDGLNRYDGSGFRIFKHRLDDPDSLASSTIYVLHQDRAGAFWVGTEDGLHRFDPAGERFERYQLTSGSPTQPAVRAIHEDGGGDLWIGTEDSLVRLGPPAGRLSGRPGGESLIHYRHDPDDPRSLSRGDVLAIHEDRAGNLWVGTTGGLDRLEESPGAEGFAHYRHDPRDPHSLGGDAVRAIHQDRAGQLWIGTRDGGLSRLAGERFVRHRHDPGDPGSLGDDNVAAIFEDRAGTLWIGTAAGLDRLAPDGQGFIHYRHDPGDSHSLALGAVREIGEDRSGNLWIGITGGGLSYFNPGRGSFDHHRHRPGDARSLGHDIVQSIFEDSARNLWVGTGGGGLDRFDPSSGRFSHYRHDPNDPRSLSHDQVWALHQDRSGSLWIGTGGGGLNRLDAVVDDRLGDGAAGSRFIRYRHDPEDPASLGSDLILSIYEDRSGTLWIGTADGLDRFDGLAAGTFSHYRHDPEDPRSLGFDIVRPIIQDRAGALWIGGAGGLDRLDPATGVFSHHRHDPDVPASLSHDVTLAIHEDRSGSLWIGTWGGGLDRRQPGREGFSHFTEEDGLINNVVYGILEDDLGRLWLSTNGGLARFDPELGTWSSYDVHDGLQDEEFNSGAYHRGADGTMYFGGVAGFNAFVPEHFRDNLQPPPIVLTSFKLFERETDFERAAPYLDTVRLSSRENFFSFEYAALGFMRPDKNRYAYHLEGFDQEWIEAGSRRYASYTNVPPGEYVFRVRGSNSDGVWNREGAALRISVARPWWRTWWASALGALALLAASAGYLRVQKNRLDRERAISDRERGVNLELRELAALKDSMLADKAVQIEERERLIEEREGLIEELQATNEELTRFNYTISHDLRTPLVTIKNYVGLVRRDWAAGKRERIGRDLERIGSAADRMHRQLEELLELSRIGRVINPPQVVALKELVFEALDGLAGQIADSRVEIDVASDLPVVRGDRARLLEVVQNLVENAIKYRRDQSSPRIEIGNGQDASSAVLHVRDNGIGIESAYHEKVFGLFERLDAATEGTGIGLALVKRIVEVHGGRVWVESAGRDRGSTFFVDLPRT